MKKTMSILLSLLLMAILVSACGKENLKPQKEPAGTSAGIQSSTDERASDKGSSDKDTPTEQETKENVTDTPALNSSSEKEEDRYLTYVLGKFVHDGNEIVYLTDQRDYDNWQVPIQGAEPGAADSSERLRFIGIDWKADGSLEQVNFCDFTFPNTYGCLETPGTSGTLNVTSYGYDVSAPPTMARWNIAVNGEEVILTNQENNYVYYFYEDHFDE